MDSCFNSITNKDDEPFHKLPDYFCRIHLSLAVRVMKLKSNEES